MEQRLILINLLVKLGLAAAIAAGLVRSVEFKSLLFREERSVRDRVYLVLWLVVSQWIGKALALGVWVRFGEPSSFAGDLSMETIILLGAIAGRFAGTLGGVLLALPALFSGSWLMLVLNVVVGLIAGQLREFAPNHEEIILEAIRNAAVLLKRWPRPTKRMFVVPGEALPGFLIW